MLSSQAFAILLAIGTSVTIVWCVVTAVVAALDGPSKLWNWWLWIAPLTLTAWLWIPWLGYGLGSFVLGVMPPHEERASTLTIEKAKP